MKRRDFVSSLGIGSAILATPALGGATGSPPQPGHAGGHDHAPLDGPLASAVINFGQWRTDPPLDRFANAPPPPPVNSHGVLPSKVKIRAGGSVSFIISGLHQILVYGPGVKPPDINVAAVTPSTGNPAGVPLIDDGNNRVYRGPDPSLLGTFDRVESVHFATRGRYLVICGVLPHFQEGMFGYINVLP